MFEAQPLQGKAIPKPPRLDLNHLLLIKKGFLSLDGFEVSSPERKGLGRKTRLTGTRGVFTKAPRMEESQPQILVKPTKTSREKVPRT